MRGNIFPPLVEEILGQPPEFAAKIKDLNGDLDQIKAETEKLQAEKPSSSFA